MIRRMWLVAAILLACVVRAGAAQDNSAADRLAGAWAGEGKLFGMDAVFTMEWAWVLDGRFLRLEFENRIPLEGKPDRVMTATAFYRPIDDGGFEGTWFDSRGKTVPLRVTTDDVTFTTHWGTPETEEGRTVYRISDGDVVVTDAVSKDGAWQEFGTARYRRRVETEAEVPVGN